MGSSIEAPTLKSPNSLDVNESIFNDSFKLSMTVLKSLFVLSVLKNLDT